MNRQVGNELCELVRCGRPYDSMVVHSSECIEHANTCRVQFLTIIG